MSGNVHTDPFAQAVAALLTLTPAELRVAARLIERVRLGHARYGALEDKLGRTDWDDEREQEFDDSVVYRQIKRVEREMATELGQRLMGTCTGCGQGIIRGTIHFDCPTTRTLACDGFPCSRCGIAQACGLGASGSTYTGPADVAGHVCEHCGLSKSPGTRHGLGVCRGRGGRRPWAHRA